MNLLVILSILLVLVIHVANSRCFNKNKRDDSCRSGDGSSYRGSLSKSANGRKCLRWTSVTHQWGLSKGIGNHHYCRNPDQNLMPWCYVLKRGIVKREYCDVPRCCKPTTKPLPTSSPPSADTERTCGERSERRNKIVGGSFTRVESHPWVAAIYLKGTFLCGGSLISPGWVLTAAHCFVGGDRIKRQHLSVFLGKTAINETDAKREQNFTVEKLINHEAYNESSYNNDIALLKIRNVNGGYAAKTPSVRTVCLPPLHTHLPAGFTCSIAGFGKQTFNSWEYSQLLKQAEVNLLSKAECKREAPYKDYVSENMFCAASPDWTTDACKGDSGGPLVCETSGRFFLFGVVSWGDGCASVNKPGVYTQVTNYNRWIAEKTGLTQYTKGLMYPQK
ncbi:plasminogen activator, urokinase a [Nothobranchius furzeri]|uniref:trypsin n=1 Tax=Nothobranchius furzeri TaxID=105023 RepID=A0A1A8ATM0_NOTFU|nr:urokinase [Nothobranchius furzeri]